MLSQHHILLKCPYSLHSLLALAKQHSRPQHSKALLIGRVTNSSTSEHSGRFSSTFSQGTVTIRSIQWPQAKTYDCRYCLHISLETPDFDRAIDSRKTMRLEPFSLLTFYIILFFLNDEFQELFVNERRCLSGSPSVKAFVAPLCRRCTVVNL